MGGRTYILFLSFCVFYIATTNSYVPEVRVPNPNNLVETKNNYYEDDKIKEDDTVILIKDWYSQIENFHNWYNAVPSNENSICGTADKGYKFVGSTQSCYKVHRTRMTWDDAEATCVREGGHLAVIKNKDQSDFFFEYIPQDRVQAFVGFHKKDGSWMTIQGRTLLEAGYLNWFRDELSDKYEACGALYRNGSFNAVPCRYRTAFICEKDLRSQIQSVTTTEVPVKIDAAEDSTTLSQEESSETRTEPTTVGVRNECGTDKEYTFFENTQSCYKVHTDRARWNDAEATCVREGGHLAVINSQDEADILTKMYPEGAMHVYVGFSYREQDSPNISDMYKIREDGVWLTIDGQTLLEAGYENWTPGEPNNAGGREYCGTIYGNGKFDDKGCYNKFDFICEIKPN